MCVLIGERFRYWLAFFVKKIQISGFRFQVAVAETPQLLFIVHYLLFIFLAIASFPVFPKGEKALNY